VDDQTNLLGRQRRVGEQAFDASENAVLGFGRRRQHLGTQDLVPALQGKVGKGSTDIDGYPCLGHG
jgi:hypothetical protein